MELVYLILIFYSIVTIGVGMLLKPINHALFVCYGYAKSIWLGLIIKVAWLLLSALTFGVLSILL